MATDKKGPRCLSADPHDKPSDPMLHYLGCLEFCDREDYLNSPNSDLDKQAVIKELRRISYLRDALENDTDETHLVKNITESMTIWRESDLYMSKYGIEAVRAWRTTRPDRPRSNGSEQQPVESPGFTTYVPDYDINAHLVMYKNSEDHTEVEDGRFRGHFPNQKINVSDLLQENQEQGRSNPILAAKQTAEEGNIISYFHLPANNMIWVEKAIARYFGEPDPVRIEGSGNRKDRPRSKMILKRRYWKGQQNWGGTAEIHARHLRSMCETISSDPDNVEAPAFSNVVLFMPYLHWETDRQRKIISQFIDKETEKDRKVTEETERQQKKMRQNSRGALVIPKHEVKGYAIDWTRKADNMKAEEVPPTVPLTVTASLAARLSLYPKHGKHLKSPIFQTDKRGRVIAKTAVGQVLFDAAMLYEAMSSYRDKKFIQKYLHEYPPLHPRRTLDQAYYWTLKTTRDRDRDQVVYRGTKPNPEHSINTITGEWNCFEVDRLAAEESKKQDQGTHSGMVNMEERQCNNCRNHIQRVSRLLMVDQLWMWILDETTIITAFPRRYGVNKQDQSGVHKSIRTRLKDLHKGHIKSVFDLALIILEECSSTFFKNRSKTADRQPQVLDIFSQAIGRINNKQTISFQHLWDWTEKLSRNSLRGGINSDMSEFIAPLLNISTEGKLQREIKDIIDELDIMINIYTQQQGVMKKFQRDVDYILKREPNGPGKDKKNAGQKPHDTDTSLSSTPDQNTGKPVEQQPPADKSVEDPNKKHTTPKRFKRMAEELLEDVEVRLAELRTLKQSAESTSNSLDALVGLKQQQASVVQAWQSVQQADETIKQGRSIMVFTVVTIVFLPLAFMSSIFGMNNPEIAGSGPMSMTTQFKLMFGISTGIIVVVMVVAYSGFVRNLFWLAYRYLITLMLVKSGAYDRVYLTLDWRSASITRAVDKEIRELKSKVKKEKQKRTAEALNKEKEAEQKGEKGQEGQKGEKGEELAWMRKSSPASSGLHPDITPSSLENGRP